MWAWQNKVMHAEGDASTWRQTVRHMETTVHEAAIDLIREVVAAVSAVSMTPLEVGI